MISIRATGERDLAGLSALFDARFGRPLAAEEWHWKYRLLPGEARSLVAVDGGGDVLAHGGALRLPARWHGGEGGIWQLVDFAGGGRGGGLHPALVQIGRRLLADLPPAGDAPWIFGFPSERHFRLGERVFGYRPLASLQPLAGPLPDAPPAGAPAADAPVAGTPPAGVPLPGAHGVAGAGLESGDSCGDWAEAIWERCAVLGVRRSAAFLNWRYWARPQRYYRFYRLLEAGHEGLAVFAFVGDEAWATELWLPPVAEWYSAMLAIGADLRSAGLRVWRFWPPPAATAQSAALHGRRGATAAGCSTAGLLRRLGVRPDGEPRFVGCRGTSGTVDPSAAASGFYYAMGDYDLA
jgi:hypothetical protein